MKKKDDRTRNWSFILYPESAPANWRDRLDGLHIKWAVSPLHDHDINDDGSPKKAHYHIVLLYDGNKSYEQIKEITDSLGQPIPQKVQNIRGVIRYLAHIDNPEKAQYDKDSIEGHGGIDIQSYLRAQSTDRYSILREMTEYIREHDIIEYCDLVDVALSEHYEDWFPLLADTNCMYISSYISSRRNSKRMPVNAITGEVM